MVAQMVVLADGEDAGILDTLPPWGLVVAGIALVMVAGGAWLFNKKLLEGDSILLEMMGFVCGIGGIMALWQGIFGG